MKALKTRIWKCAQYFKFDTKKSSSRGLRQFRCIVEQYKTPKGPFYPNCENRKPSLYSLFLA